MQVTQEDGGRLNAFAKEPRMEVISNEASISNGSRLLIISGAMLAFPSHVFRLTRLVFALVVGAIAI